MLEKTSFESSEIKISRKIQNYEQHIYINHSRLDCRKRNKQKIEESFCRAYRGICNRKLYHSIQRLQKRNTGNHVFVQPKSKIKENSNAKHISI